MVSGAFHGEMIEPFFHRIFDYDITASQIPEVGSGSIDGLEACRRKCSLRTAKLLKLLSA
jgi:hypothetical protein